MIYSDGMPSYGIILLPSFMKICTDVQFLLRFYLSNLNDCIVCLTEGKNLQRAPLKWAQMA
jgi:hypothetical protein